MPTSRGEVSDPVAAGLKAVAEFCERRVPEDLRDRVRLEAHRQGIAVTIVERRPPWSPDLGPEWTASDVARLRFDRSTEKWELAWKRSDGRWYTYERIESATDIGSLLAEVDDDPHGVVWG